MQPGATEDQAVSGRHLPRIQTRAPHHQVAKTEGLLRRVGPTVPNRTQSKTSTGPNGSDTRTARPASPDPKTTRFGPAGADLSRALSPFRTNQKTCRQVVRLSLPRGCPRGAVRHPHTVRCCVKSKDLRRPEGKNPSGRDRYSPGPRFGNSISTIAFIGTRMSSRRLCCSGFRKAWIVMSAGISWPDAVRGRNIKPQITPMTRIKSAQFA